MESKRSELVHDPGRDILNGREAETSTLTDM